MDVNLYIRVSIKGPKRTSGAYQYLLNAETSKGPQPRGAMKTVEEDTTAHHLTLLALEEALGRMKRPSELHIYLEDPYVFNVFHRGWLEEWQQNGWKNARNKPVTDVDLWKRIVKLLEEHLYDFHVGEEHEYTEWMNWMMEKKEDYYV